METISEMQLVEENGPTVNWRKADDPYCRDSKKTSGSGITGKTGFCPVFLRCFEFYCRLQDLHLCIIMQDGIGKQMIWIKLPVQAVETFQFFSAVPKRFGIFPMILYSKHLLCGGWNQIDISIKK